MNYNPAVYFSDRSENISYHPRSNHIADETSHGPSAPIRKYKGGAKGIRIFLTFLGEQNRNSEKFKGSRTQILDVFSQIELGSPQKRQNPGSEVSHGATKKKVSFKGFLFSGTTFQPGGTGVRKMIFKNDPPLIPRRADLGAFFERSATENSKKLGPRGGVVYTDVGSAFLGLGFSRIFCENIVNPMVLLA